MKIEFDPKQQKLPKISASEQKLPKISGSGYI